MSNPEVIPVIINGITYPTYLDEHGTQRFVPNGIIYKMIESSLSDFDKPLGERPPSMNLNDASIFFQNGGCGMREYIEFGMLHGYSVSGLEDIIYGVYDQEELDPEQHYTIINPLWDPEADTTGGHAPLPHWEPSAPLDEVESIELFGRTYYHRKNASGEDEFIPNRLVQEFVRRMGYFTFNLDNVEQLLENGQVSTNDYYEFHVLNGMTFSDFQEMAMEKFGTDVTNF